jgi:hypothetical protein
MGWSARPMLLTKTRGHGPIIPSCRPFAFRAAKEASLTDCGFVASFEAALSKYQLYALVQQTLPTQRIGFTGL